MYGLWINPRLFNLTTDMNTKDAALISITCYLFRVMNRSRGKHMSISREIYTD